MSFIDFIEKLQNKPQKTRIRVFIVAMIFSVIIIFMAFIFSAKNLLYYRDNVSDAEDVGETLNYKKLPSIMDSIKSSVSEIFILSKKIKNDDSRDVYEKSVNRLEGERLPIID